MDVLEIAAIAIWALVLICLLFWLAKAAPSKPIRRKYRWLVGFQSLLPFMEQWRGKIERTDIPIFEQYRRRFLILYVALLLPGAFFFVYAYVRYIYLGG